MIKSTIEVVIVKELTKVEKEIARFLRNYISNTVEVLFYESVSNAIDNKISAKNLGEPLGNISMCCYELDLPLLSTIVISQEEMIPGDGYFELLQTLGVIVESELTVEQKKELAKKQRDRLKDKNADWTKFDEYIGIVN